ncbi:MAG: FtsW/RodA/SpoVE family cell cycle protein [bacterium]|nr:FtsW/RodA/SpoVE family cell cycle protein [bacterium]
MYNTRSVGAVLMLLVTLLLAYGSYVLSLMMPAGLPPLEPFKYAALIAGSGWGVWLILALMKKRGDCCLLPTALFLVSFSWLEIYSLGLKINEPMQGPRQAVLTAISMACFLLMVLFLRNYRILEEYKYLFLCSGLALQLAVMMFGVAVNGASLWFRVGGLSFQPFEFVKIFIIIFLAAYLRQFRYWLRLGFVSKEGRLPRKALLKLGLGMAAAELILVAQRDLGMALLLFGIFIAMFYITTGRRDILLLTFVLSGGGAYFCWKYFSHVQVRVANWLDPFADAKDIGYQMCQAIFSLSNAGIDGTGLGLSKAYVIPEVVNDFTFVAITEEFGMLGCAALIVGLMILVSRSFAVAIKVQDEFGTILAAGLASLLAWQSLIIMLGDTKMIPMTGITLPFVSAGGCSLLSSFMVVALIWIIDASDVDSAGISRRPETVRASGVVSAVAPANVAGSAPTGNKKSGLKGDK